jgi:hypothetical protein
MSYQPDPNSDKFIEKLNFFEQKHRPFINLIVKPLMTVSIFLAVGYYTMWMSTTYVKQDKFTDYLKQQIELDKKQDEVLKNRFEVTQGKLEVIINNQVSFTEQLRAYNQLLSNFQKQLDGVNDRVTFIERHLYSKGSN